MNNKKSAPLQLLVIFTLLFCMSTLIIGCSTETEESDLPTETTNFTQELSASGEVVPAKWVTLTFPSGATDVKIYVEEGQNVSEGRLLVESKDTRLLAALYQAEAALARAQYAYDQTVNAPSEAVLANARSLLANAEANLESQEFLLAINSVIDAAEADIAAAEANLAEVEAGASDEEIEAAENDLQAAEYNYEQAKKAFVIRAPFSGTIVEINAKSGEAIAAFQPVAILADLSELQIVTTDLSEVDVAQLKVGQSAEIVFDAISDRTFIGQIERIADKSTGVSSVYYEVVLTLDEIPDELRWGMTAFIIFPIE